MGLKSLNISLVLEHNIFDQLENRRSQSRLGTTEIERRASQAADHLRIIVLHPFGIEFRSLPPKRNDGFHIFPHGGDDVEEHPATITSGFITIHLEERVVSGRQAFWRLLQYSNGAPLALLSPESGHEKAQMAYCPFASSERWPAGDEHPLGQEPLLGAVRSSRVLGRPV